MANLCLCKAAGSLWFSPEYTPKATVHICYIIYRCFSAAPHFLNLYNQGGQCKVNMTMGHIIKNTAMKPEFSLIWSISWCSPAAGGVVVAFESGVALV